MNIRIKELAEQATKHYPATETYGEFSTFDKEKFAELIVRECAEVSKKYAGGSMPVSIASAIKEHFGVEE